MRRFSFASLWMVVTLAAFAGVRSLIAVDDQQTAAERAREDFELMKLLAEAYEQIDTNYVQEVDRRELVNAAIRGMAGYLDQHSTYIPPRDLPRFEQVLEQEFVGIGVHVNSVGGNLQIVSPLTGSPAARAGLRSGDTIVEIDGQSTSGMTPSDAAKLLTGHSGRPVVLGIRKPGSETVEQITVVRAVIQLPTVVSSSRNADDQWEFMLHDDQKIGYVHITHFSRNTAHELQAALEGLVDRGLKALVVDVRSNPGGLMESSIEIADMFLETGTIVSMKGRAVRERRWTAEPGTAIPDIPVAVLVNRLSASASEVLSACLQDNKRAVIVGERTFGKGSVQNVIQLESGRSALKLTTAGYFRPSGINIHRSADSRSEDDWGVKPTDGHAVELEKERWLEWTKFHEASEVLSPRSSVAGLPVFDDLQLNHAVAYLSEQLKSGLESGQASPAAENGDSPLPKGPEEKTVGVSSEPKPSLD